MKFRLFFLFLLFSQLCLAQVQKLEGTNLTFELPSNKWFLADTQRTERLAIFTYKREAIENKEGRQIIPNIAFIVEQVPDGTDAISYSMHHRASVPNVTEVFTHSSKKTKLRYQNGMGYKGSYTDKQGLGHSIYMLHLINAGKGIRVIFDITSDLSEKYDAEFVKLMRSIKEE